ncbi:hypothetical protein [Actinomadura kijaniata]|uniref:hypothetical protein n=1 Tax=Actinomadura kijaniata TaxID=46161 RepID=UPI0008373D81|nr:hypothetical protein [Actinomadura kijaniata]
MAVASVLVSPQIQDQLGDEGLAEVTRHLWPADCQSCGKPLGSQRPSLVVDNLEVFATASLHHQRCRTPQWNQGHITGTNQPTLSFRVGGLMLPIQNDPRPMLVVNPGLESVILNRQDDQRWKVQHNSYFTKAGLVPPGRSFVVDHPIDGAVARLTTDSIAVTLQVAPFPTYECALEEHFRQEAARLKGVLLGVTHLVDPWTDPHTFTRDLDTALRSGEMLLGWVPLHGTHTPAPRTGPPGTHYVLRWTPHCGIVGPVLAQTPKTLVQRKARNWAKSMISPDEGTLMSWEPIDPKVPEAGWITMSTLSAKFFALLPHAEGWYLVQALTRGGGRDLTTDNEAKAWAGQVLQIKSGITGLEWRPGPQQPGVSTLYATP